MNQPGIETASLATGTAASSEGTAPIPAVEDEQLHQLQREVQLLKIDGQLQ